MQWMQTDTSKMFKGMMKIFTLRRIGCKGVEAKFIQEKYHRI